MNAAAQFAIAAGSAAVGVALLRPLARRTGAVAAPRCDRWHVARCVPRLSGPALLVAMMPWAETGVLVVLAGFCAIGVLDDYRALRPATKALLLLVPSIAAGWITAEPWAAPMCWVVANAVNMLDHADGVAPSACSASLALAGGTLGVAGAGAVMGFLVHNWPPARAFLGDGGSLLLGVLLVLAWSPHGPIAVAFGAAVPLADAAFVVSRRLYAGRAPWLGGTDHSAHALLTYGAKPAWLPFVYASTAGAAAAFGLSL